MTSSLIENFSGITLMSDEVEKKTLQNNDSTTESSINLSDDRTLFNRKNIELLSDKIALVDSDESAKLDMFCYIKCTPEDNDLVKQCRGIIFNGDECILKAFPYTLEYNHTEIKEISNTITNINEWTFFEAHEGALVRVFYYGSKWHISTHRKLNAFRSKWASQESFGASFKNALLSNEEINECFRKALPRGENIIDRFEETLDKNKQYMFLILNSENNRIVCSPPEHPTVYHVGTFVTGKLSLNEETLVQKPKSVVFQTIHELVSYVEKISYKHLQGVIGFNTFTNTQVKIVHKDYQDLFNVRGNEPSIKFRYIQCRMKPELVKSLEYLYPTMKTAFEEIENNIYGVAQFIYNAYVERFIRRNYVTVPKEEFAVIKECHSWHLSNRTENRISLDQIITVLNNQPATNINHMVRRFKLNKNKQTQSSQSDNTKNDLRNDYRREFHENNNRDNNQENITRSRIPSYANVASNQNRGRKPLYTPDNTV